MNKISRRSFLGQMCAVAAVSVLWSFQSANAKSLRAESNSLPGYGIGAYNTGSYPAANTQIFLPYIAKEG